MPSKNPAQRLRDLVDNIDVIREFTAGMDRDGFAADRKTVYAVVRALEIISEASRRLPAGLKDSHPEIDWAAVAAAGNVYGTSTRAWMLFWSGTPCATASVSFAWPLHMNWSA